MDDLGTGHLRGQIADLLGALHRDVDDAGLVQSEDDAALQGGGRVVEVDDGAFGPFDALEGAVDQVIARLGQHLDGDVVGDHVLFDQFAHEVEVGLGGGGKADLDLLEAHLHQHLEHAPLARAVHRFDQGLVAVAQVDRAPDRRRGDDPARPLPVRQVDGFEGGVLLARNDPFADFPGAVRRGFAVHGLGSSLPGGATSWGSAARRPVKNSWRWILHGQSFGRGAASKGAAAAGKSPAGRKPSGKPGTTGSLKMGRAARKIGGKCCFSGVSRSSERTSFRDRGCRTTALPGALQAAGAISRSDRSP